MEDEEEKSINVQILPVRADLPRDERDGAGKEVLHGCTFPAYSEKIRVKIGL